jgi:hypothetical protein
MEEACEWLTRVFAFAEYYRHGQRVGGILMYLGDAYIMLIVSDCVQSLTVPTTSYSGFRKSRSKVQNRVSSSARRIVIRPMVLLQIRDQVTD